MDIIVTDKKLENIPEFISDEAAENFVAEENLAEYDLSDFKKVNFEFQPKDAKINMRIPSALLEDIKNKAAEKGISYQRYIRMTPEESIRHI